VRARLWNNNQRSLVTASPLEGVLLDRLVQMRDLVVHLGQRRNHLVQNGVGVMEVRQEPHTVRNGKTSITVTDAIWRKNKDCENSKESS
jgi:hypothetical protein